MNMITVTIVISRTSAAASPTTQARMVRPLYGTSRGGAEDMDTLPAGTVVGGSFDVLGLISLLLSVEGTSSTLLVCTVLGFTGKE